MTRSSAQFTQPAESSSPSALLVVDAVVLGLAGLALAVAGAWLIALGGSWYYLVAGLGLIASALLLKRGGGIGLLFYAAVVLLTLVWALWEVGFDWWPLAARGDVFFVIGLFLLTPWVARALARRDATGIGRTRAVLGVVLAAFLLAAVFSWTREPGRIEGIAPLPDASANATATPRSPARPRRRTTGPPTAAPASASATRRSTRSRRPTSGSSKRPGTSAPATCAASPATRKRRPSKSRRSRSASGSFSARRTRR
jgi:quinoprotein glucose dehydrogenase